VKEVWLIAGYSLDILGPQRLRKALDEIGRQLGGWDGRKIGWQGSKDRPAGEIMGNRERRGTTISEIIDRSHWPENQARLGKEFYTALGYRPGVAAEYVESGAELVAVDHPAAKVLKRARRPKTEEQLADLFAKELGDFAYATVESKGGDPNEFIDNAPYGEFREEYLEFQDLKYDFGEELDKESRRRVEETFKLADLKLDDFLEVRCQYMSERIAEKCVDVFVGEIEQVYGLGDLAPKKDLYERLKERGLRIHRVRLDDY
jgi:hypothetical protein